MLRPFSEARGLRADQIRLQREDVLIEIAKKVRERMIIEEQRPHPIPLRIMVPLLEKASLTDPGSDALMDAWARLLQSASQGDGANYGLFVDILAKLDPVHLRFLELLARVGNNPPDMFAQREVFFVEEFLGGLISNLQEDPTLIDNEDKFAEQFGVSLSEYFNVAGCGLVAAGLHFRPDREDDAYYEVGEGISIWEYPEAVRDALESLNVVRTHYVRFEAEDVFVWISYCVLTYFGLEFFDHCHPPRLGSTELKRELGELERGD